MMTPNDCPSGRKCWPRRSRIVIWAGAALLSIVSPNARAAAPPVTVAAPKGINLGTTSFFDGFGRTAEGWTWLQYGRFENLTRITDDRGNTSPLFKGTAIKVFVSQTQIAYTSGWHPFGGDGVGVSALLPIADFDSHFAGNSPVKLGSNGFGIGDLTIGPFYQSKHYVSGNRPVFAFRAQLSVVVPIGSVNTRRDINQGAGFWALNPFIAVTWMPTPRLEFSGRLNYQYNFSTTTLQDPPPVPGLVYRNGQAGQMIYGNFAMSYAVRGKLRLGVNGYALAQLTDNSTNGEAVPQSRETEVSIGPGARYEFDAARSLNLNLYLPVVSRNATSGTQVNAQFVRRF